MFIVYILQSQTSSRYYVGYTSNIIERLERHNSGRSKHTKKERPWIIIYKETFASRVEAMRREKEIKSYKGATLLKN